MRMRSALSTYHWRRGPRGTEPDLGTGGNSWGVSSWGPLFSFATHGLADKDGFHPLQSFARWRWVTESPIKRALTRFGKFSVVLPR